MKKYAILLMLCLVSCSVTPQIISPKQQTKQVQQTPRVVVKEGGWGWILWYVPIAGLALMWGYKELLKKKDKKDQTIQ